MTGAVAIQTVVSGLSTGSAYVLIAIGFTLLQRLTGVIAFAHGDLAIGSVFVGVILLLGSAPTAATLGLASSAGLAIVVLAAGALASVLVYLLAVRPFVPRVGRAARGWDVAGWVGGGLAAGLLVRALLGLAFDQDAYAVPDPLHLSQLNRSGLVHLPGGAVVTTRTLGVLGIGLVVGLLAERLLVASRVGVRMRAVSDDATAAALLGLPVRRLTLLAFAVAGALAGLAGLLIAPGQSISVDSGVVLGLKAIAGATLGGLGSIRGALAGGLVIGLIEAFAVQASFLGPRYADVLPLAIVVLALALAPLRSRAVVLE
ncbi:branched-chain amino acid ABC transporter permease [Rugosimonospora acidiphila]|uniref:Branched-chain amino acid ABC transporter permease n=1 Tax=Rugosimonospora acidiphila TaxID=556531 RepID=A0ABP9RSY3_9ACTN